MEDVVQKLPYNFTSHHLPSNTGPNYFEHFDFISVARQLRLLNTPSASLLGDKTPIHKECPAYMTQSNLMSRVQ